MSDYAGGKAEWVAAGRPLEHGEGHGAEQGSGTLRASLTEVMLTGDVVTCGLDDPVEQVRLHVQDSPLEFAVATGADRVVLGKARARDLGAAGDPASVADALVEGPTTVRADQDPGELVDRMEHAETGSLLVTTAQGELLGVLRRDDARRHAAASAGADGAGGEG